MAARKRTRSKPASAKRERKSSRKSPTHLTPELARALVDTAKTSDLFDAQVAIENNVHPKTLRKWLEQGLAEGAEEPHRSFAHDYAKAQIGVERGKLQDVRAGTEAVERGLRPGDWKASAWYLERRWPKRYNPSFVAQGGPKDVIDLEGLIEKLAEQDASLLELLRDPPAELLAAMQEARDEILAVLGATPAALPKPTGE